METFGESWVDSECNQMWNVERFLILGAKYAGRSLWFQSKDVKEEKKVTIKEEKQHQEIDTSPQCESPSRMMVRGGHWGSDDTEKWSNRKTPKQQQSCVTRKQKKKDYERSHRAFFVFHCSYSLWKH